MYIRIRYELESFQALKLNTDVDRVLGSVLDHAESDPIMQKGVKNPDTVYEWSLSLYACRI